MTNYFFETEFVARADYPREEFIGSCGVQREMAIKFRNKQVLTFNRARINKIERGLDVNEELL